MHIDDWLDKATLDPHLSYAKFVLEYFRRPAWQLVAFKPYMGQHKLYCTYKGKRYRCTGASRRGDVWLALNFSTDAGYDERVDVTECSEWSDKPERNS